MTKEGLERQSKTAIARARRDAFRSLTAFAAICHTTHLSRLHLGSFFPTAASCSAFFFLYFLKALVGFGALGLPSSHSLHDLDLPFLACPQFRQCRR